MSKRSLATLKDAWRECESLMPALRALYFKVWRLTNILERLDAALIARDGVFESQVANLAAAYNEIVGRSVWRDVIVPSDIAEVYDSLRALARVAGVHIDPLRQPPPVKEWWMERVGRDGRDGGGDYKYLAIEYGTWADAAQSIRTVDKCSLDIDPAKIANDGSLKN